CCIQHFTCRPASYLCLMMRIPLRSTLFPYTTLFRSIFLGEEAIRGKVFSELQGLIGASAARQIQEVIKNLSLSGKSNLALIISAVTLLIGATTVFGDIQNSINKIWHVRPKVKKGWLKVVKDRLLSSSLVIGLGFLLVVTLIINGVILAFTERLQRIFPDISVFF